MPFTLKPGLLLGVTNAPTQADGGHVDHSWSSWYARGHIKDGSDPAVAAAHWEHWREDILLMGRLGVRTFRLGVEWARMEPAEGRFDDGAIAHLREEILLLRAMGIAPVLVLHHFTDPTWFEARGGWQSRDAVHYFLRYVEKIVRTVGHLANEYVTINEPNTYAVNGYYFGIWPPAKKAPAAAVEVMSVMAAAHIRAYRLIHEVRRSMGFEDTRVGAGIHMRVFAPRNARNPLHSAAARTARQLFQEVLLEAMVTGRFHRPLKDYARVRQGRYADFYDLSYYSRSMVSRMDDGLRENAPRNVMGWEIYPLGLITVLQDAQRIAPLPVYLTTGVCDNDDSFRCRYIHDHLQALCSTDIPVERYYHRSLLDGFEWLAGKSARFGLVEVAEGSFVRSVKESGRFYAEVIRRRGVDEELYEQFVAGQSYHK